MRSVHYKNIFPLDPDSSCEKIKPRMKLTGRTEGQGNYQVFFGIMNANPVSSFRDIGDIQGQVD